jgi:hypothetical protein
MSMLVMKSRTTLILALLLSLQSVSSLAASLEPQEPQWEAALNVLRFAKTYDSSAVGYAGVKTDTYQAYEMLRDTAPMEVLQRLVDDENSIVRVYAFKALQEKHLSPELFPILERHFTDEESINTFIGCIGSSSKVADMMIGFLEGDLDAQQREKLIRFLLTNKNNLETKDIVLEDWDLGPEFYTAIRSLVEAGESTAIEALARYKKDEDVDLILGVMKANKYHAFRAIEHFQHPRLWSALMEQSEEVLGQKSPAPFVGTFYQAVATFQTQESAVFLNSVMMRIHVDFHDIYLKSILRGISEHVSPVYIPLYYKFWLEHRLLTVPALEVLLRYDRDRTVRVISETLAGDVNEFDQDVLAKLLEEIVRNTTHEALSALDDAGRAAGPVAFPKVARAMSSIRAESSIKVLIKRVREKWQPYIVLPAAQALIAYDRPSLSELVNETLKSIPALSDGYWAEKARMILAGEPAGMEDW